MPPCIEHHDETGFALLWPGGERIQHEWRFSDRQYMQEVLHGTDRSVAVVSGAYLDACLYALIASFLVEDEQADILLGHTSEPRESGLATYAARARAAYCLGLLGSAELQDLLAMGRIRNHFAHETNPSFEHPRIKRQVRRLRASFEASGLRQPIEEYAGVGATSPTRIQFILHCRVLLWHLQLAAALAEHRRCQPFGAEDLPTANCRSY